MLQPWNAPASKKGTGFVQPLAPHEHWHTDISYLNICGTFYYLCSVLDAPCRGINPFRRSHIFAVQTA
jgi:putative transposase